MRYIVGFEGKYSITEDGRVFSHKYNIFRKLKKDRYGYLYLGLTTTKRKQKFYTIHRLVALGFIDNPENLPCINHKDGNKLNNNVSNLEWCSWKYNTNHAWNLGLCKPYDRKENYNRQGIIDSNKRRQIRGI